MALEKNFNHRPIRRMDQRFLQVSPAANEAFASSEPACDMSAIANHLVDPYRATSEQGAFASDCEVFAAWGEVALFRSSLTGQYGVGLLSTARDQRVLDCYQFARLDIAIRMFIIQGSQPAKAVR
jgi:hypothetical protein